MVLALTRILRSRVTVLATTIVLFIAIVVITFTPHYREHFSLYQNWIPMNMMKFAAIFLVGALIYLYRDRIPDSGWLALGCLGIFIGCLWLPTPNIHPAVTFTGSAIMAPILTYPILWLGAHLPFQKIGATNDYSYGFYIYAFPVQQILATWGVIHLGYLPYTVVVVLVTAPFAVGSWWLIERHAMRLKKFDPRNLRRARPPPRRQPRSFRCPAKNDPSVVFRRLHGRGDAPGLALGGRGSTRRAAMGGAGCRRWSSGRISRWSTLLTSGCWPRATRRVRPLVIGRSGLMSRDSGQLQSCSWSSSTRRYRRSRAVTSESMFSL